MKIKGYIISVICISVITSLVSMLSPEGDGGGTGKCMKLMCGLCIVMVSVNPIIDMVKSIKEYNFGSFVADNADKNEYQDIFDLSYGAAELDNLKYGIKQMLSDRFGVDTSECEIKLTVRKNESGDNELERISVILCGTAIFKNTAEIEQYLSKIFSCEIITAID